MESITLDYYFKRIFICLIVILNAAHYYSQIIYTKDRVEIGDRNEMVEIMVEVISAQGYGDDTWKYCTCIVDEVFPRITFAEMVDYTERNAFEELMSRSDILPLIEECVLDNIEELSDVPMEIAERQDFIDNCVIGALLEIAEFGENQYSIEDWELYCNCVWDKMIEKQGVTIGDIMESENENSVAFMELVLPCLPSGDSELFGGIDWNRDARVSGCRANSVIDLINYGGSLKVKLEIGGISRYFLLDTGASDLLVDADLEREWLLDGFIGRSNYVGTEIYELADGSQVEADMIRVPSIKIGGCTVYDAVVAVLPEGGMLLGTGFLEIFSNYSINSDDSTLVLSP